MNDKKQADSRLIQLRKHYESELEKQKQLGEFYAKKLKDLRIRRQKLQSMAQGTPKMQLQQNQYSESNAEISRSIPNSSLKSIQLNKDSRIKKQSELRKQEGVDFQFQYNTYVKSISKNLQQIAAKAQQTQAKKYFQTTSRMNASFTQKSMKTSTIKPQVNKSTLSPTKKLKSEAEVKLSKKEQIILDFGNNSLLQGEDQIVNNLVQKLKQEEQKYIEGVLAQTQLKVKQKMKNFMQKQIQKNEEILFNMKQKVIDKSLNKLSSNKQTVKSGYTEKMKQLVQNGLKHRNDII